MSERKRKLCSCGFPQSKSIPHEHDQTNREKAIVKYFEKCVADLLTVCQNIYKQDEKEDFLSDTNLQDLEAAIEKAT